MLRVHVFTDGSVNVKARVGYGACLIVTDLTTPFELLKDKIKVKRFEQTSSTKLELQTFLWALGEAVTTPNNNEDVLTVYTDCQNIISLPERRARLELSNFFSSKNKRLNHFELYQEFYRVTATLNCELIKVVGHTSFGERNNIDKLFRLVDQASRHALREEFVAKDACK
ncbi:MAG: RNase H family protein [Pseudomonadota bacterium]